LDGRDEWLIWVEGHYNPLLFVSDGDDYHISSSDFQFISGSSLPTMLENYRLPDDAGQAWITWSLVSIPGEVDCVNYECAHPWCSWLHYLHIWQLENGELVDRQQIPICEAPSIDELFPTNKEILGWTDTGDPDIPAEPITYVWDAQQRLYLLPVSVTPTPTLSAPPNPVITPTPASNGYYNYFYYFRTAFEEKDFDKALQIIDNALLDPGHSAFPDLHYWRGLTLEALNHPDDALAEYVAIYQAAPDSAWGQLARLHLDCVKGCAS
jgi:hypothetical protein